MYAIMRITNYDSGGAAAVGLSKFEGRVVPQGRALGRGDRGSGVLVELPFYRCVIKSTYDG